MRIIVILLFLIISCSTAPKQTSEYFSFQGWTAKRVEYLPEGSGQVSQVLLLERPTKNSWLPVTEYTREARFLSEASLEYSTLFGERPSATQIDFFCKNANRIESISYRDLEFNSLSTLMPDLSEEERKEAKDRLQELMSKFSNGQSPVSQSWAHVEQATGTYTGYAIDCRYSGEMRWKAAHLHALSTFRILALSKFTLTAVQLRKKMLQTKNGKDKEHENMALFLAGTIIALEAEKNLDTIYDTLKKNKSEFKLSGLFYEVHENFTKEFTNSRKKIVTKWEENISKLPTSEQKRLRDLLKIKDPDEIMRRLEELAKD